jgi:hypothetical protein
VTAWSRGALVVALALSTSCSSSGGSSGPAINTPLPATAPYLEMTGPNAGVAVWPSGTAWLVLSTEDGFAHVTNRTPQGVETDGGLVATVTAGGAIVAVGAHERLLRSPVLTADPAWHWSAGELPGAIADSRAAVSSTPTTAVIDARGGTQERRDNTDWTRVTDAGALAPGTTLDAITWASARVGWLTGYGHGRAAAFGTTDAGATWTPVPQATGSITAALAPCGSGSSWLMPVIRSGTTILVLRTADDGARWTPGAAVAVADAGPVVGCAGETLWLDSRSAGHDRILASSDGGASWTDRGAAPDRLTDLTPTAGGAGFATSGGEHPQLWRVTGDGAQFSPVTLPGWVASLGKQVGGGG